MKWTNYTSIVELKDEPKQPRVKAFVVRAVSCKHALTKATRQYPDAISHEVIKCRCDEVKGDMCDACYFLHFNQ